MKNKTYSTLIIWLLLSTIVCAQNKIVVPKFNHEKKFGDFIYMNLIHRNDITSSICLRFIGSIKIVLNDKGTIDSVSISKNVPENIKKILIEASWETDLLWTPMYVNNKPVTSYPIIQIINFEIASGCEAPNYRPWNSNENFTKYLFTYSETGKPFEGSLNSIMLPARSFILNYGFTDLNPKKKKK